MPFKLLPLSTILSYIFSGNRGTTGIKCGLISLKLSPNLSMVPQSKLQIPYTNKGGKTFKNMTNGQVT